MRLKVTGTLIILTLLSAVFFSCKTTPSSTQDIQARGDWTRTGFAENLGVLLTQGKYDEAVALFDTVPAKDASDPAIRKLKLSVLISVRQLEKAGALATELETAYPADAEVLYSQAVLASARNDAAARTKYLNAVIKVDPANSDALTGLGLDLFSAKNYPQAKIWLVKAVSANPDNTDALLGLARVYYMQNELPKAQDTLTLAVAKEPGYSVLWAELARVKSENGDLPGAIEDIKKAVALDPGIYSQWTDYGNYLISVGRKEEARNAFGEAIRIDPSQYFAYIYRAGINDDLGHTDEAIADYRVICSVYPQYYFAAESLGVLLWGKGDYEGSGNAFSQALSYAPMNVSYALMTTLSVIRQNREADAKAFMAKYITTLDRTTNDYFLCRLFVDKNGEMDVINRITKEKNISSRNRMLFYVATYFELYSNKTIAQKYYLEVLDDKAPTFFEYRLTQWALKSLENQPQN